jgi:hypothetical protein
VANKPEHPVTSHEKRVLRKIRDGAADFQALTAAILVVYRELVAGSKLVARLKGVELGAEAFTAYFDQHLRASKTQLLRQRTGRELDAKHFERYLAGLSSEKERDLARAEAKVYAWNRARGGLFELLALLVTLRSSWNDGSLVLGDVMAPLGPLRIVEESVERYLWTRPTVSVSVSGLKARPDILVSNTADSPGPDTIVRVVECKNVKAIDASLLRQEFGKARDLEVAAYALLSYQEVAPAKVQAANRLGLDLDSIGLYGPLREEVLADAPRLAERVTSVLDSSKRENRFLQRSSEVVQRARTKLLGAN